MFEDFVLPNLEDTQVSEVETVAWNKSGYKTSGSPSSMSLRQTMHNSFGRRTALNRPKPEELVALEKELHDLENDLNVEDTDILNLKEQIKSMKSRMGAISYIDPYDIRYYNLVPVPKPIYSAVMYCLMDVSGSMTEHMKDLAKRFYILLYKFLKMKYARVEVVFIRHTHEAFIVDEDTFFNDRQTGGTVVSTGLEKIVECMKDKYPPASFNSYIAQCSDGDNARQDNPFTQKLILEEILPLAKYFAYLEVSADPSDVYASWYTSSTSDLWSMYNEIAETNPKKFVVKKANTRSDIYPVLHDLFSRKE